MRPMLLVAVLVLLAAADRCAPELEPGCPWTPAEVGDGCRCTRPSSDLCAPPAPGAEKVGCKEGFVRICRDNRMGSFFIKVDEPPPTPPAPPVRRSGSRR